MSHSSRYPRRNVLRLGLAGMALPPLASMLAAPRRHNGSHEGQAARSTRDDLFPQWRFAAAHGTR